MDGDDYALYSTDLVTVGAGYHDYQTGIKRGAVRVKDRSYMTNLYNSCISLGECNFGYMIAFWLKVTINYPNPEAELTIKS